ncbi:reverse transcriptase domain-containing protein [Tanacetum coccineum]|uniref:Reverse transcriptase domain-containing protein n=1 Tax=Tanacetum coccineum TaxID=301880 RepID=A0ABQ5JB78_9ASTR
MDDPYITMEECIQLKADKGHMRSQEFNWENATYGKREHEEIEIFINEFRTTNELLLKERSNLLSELKIEFNDAEPWFGVSKALISDRGTHFCNSQLEKALQKYGVTHKLFTAYHPQTNWQTKVTNKAIKRILERSVGYNPKDWSERLNDALWAFRMAYKTPTRCTPFRLVYEKACRLLVEIEHKAHWALKQCNMDLKLGSKSRLLQLNELSELRVGAYENTRIYKERTKKWHDSRLRGEKYFKEGDKVLLL